MFLEGLRYVSTFGSQRIIELISSAEDGIHADVYSGGFM
jgi:hypothetical protein